jgi:dephospho-CoA kinase
MSETHFQPPPQQRIIGLTGGIGMGKTTVSEYLATAHHLPVLDADIYAREAVAPGTSVLAAITDRYGLGVLHADGSLDRQRLGDIVFASPSERLWLEQQIHPYVRDGLIQTMQSPPYNLVEQHPILVLVIPLLFEARMTDLVTETWVVTCSPEQQLARLTERDRLTANQAQARIDSQLAIEKKVARADVVLDNSSTLESLFEQIDQAIAHPAHSIALPHPF